MTSLPRLRLPLLAALILAAALSAPAWSRESAAEVHVQTDFMMPMRDGVRLATDIYRPAAGGQPAEGKFHVILTRIPYNKDGAKRFGEYFAKNGYIFVAQDTRGRYKSEGVWRFLDDDGPDGADCAAWIGEQDWFAGKIGMTGTSYVGGTQHALALEGSPHLAAVIPVDAVSNMGIQSMRNAGAFELRFWNWILINAGRGSRAARDPDAAAMLKEMADHRMAYLPRLPLRRGMTPLRHSPEYEDWLVEAMRRGANDEFWQVANIVGQPGRYQDIPVYLVGGWYDSWAGNTTANFAALTEALESDVYLIMGPWIHGAQSRSAHGQVDFGEAAAIPDELAWRKEWFDRWLKGEENSVGKAAPFASKVRIFVMGTGSGGKTADGKLDHGGYWRDESEWPLSRARAAAFYLGPGGALALDAPEEAGAVSFTYDPRDPVPTIGGNISSGDGILLQGAWDQRGGEHVWNWPHPLPLSARNDVLVFQSEPLEEDVEVTGPVMVRLWASSSAVDTDFTAKLIDVHPASEDWPGGFDLNLGDGIVRARFRDSLEEEKLMVPGEIYPFTILLYPTSNVFKKGHRIRVDISSSNFPRFDLNPNTGEPLNDHRRMEAAVNTIYHGPEHPSRLLLHVVPLAK